MTLNKTLWSCRELLARCLSLAAGAGLCANAWGNCMPAETGPDNDCLEAYVYDWQESNASLPPWQSVPVESDTATVGDTENSAAKVFTPDAGLRFEVPVIVPNTQPLPSPPPLTVFTKPEEPGFALLLGNLAQLMSDGSIALGRSAKRSYSRTARRSAYKSQLPNAFDPWDQQLDVDLGLSFSSSGRFNTSVGYAESIGEDDLDPAFVGWFEFRF